MCKKLPGETRFRWYLPAYVDKVALKLADLEQKLITVTAEFSRVGSDESKRSGEMYRSQIDDLKFRLELYGYKPMVGGWLSPYYSKYFEVHYCGYCNRSFSDLIQLQQHKDGCLRDAMRLKSDLHQKIQRLVSDLENTPNNAVVQSQIKYLRECHALISYKLNVYDAVPCTEHAIL